VCSHAAIGTGTECYNWTNCAGCWLAGGEQGVEVGGGGTGPQDQELIPTAAPDC
jgi:hypothetical protein